MRHLQRDVGVVGAAVIEQQADKGDQVRDDLLETGNVEVIVVIGHRTEGRMQLGGNVWDHADKQGVRKQARLRPIKSREDDCACKEIQKERDQIARTVHDAPARIKNLRHIRPRAQENDQIRHAGK